VAVQLRDFRFAQTLVPECDQPSFYITQFQTRQMTYFSHCGSWVFSRAPGLAEVR
jgi:hypothetical protein